MVVNWADVLVTCLLIVVLWKAEQAYRIWRWKRSRKPSNEPSKDESTLGHVAHAAQAAPCGKCGVLTKNFFAYADGDQWCERCHEESE